MVARHWEVGEWGVSVNGYRISFQIDDSVLELGGSDACTTLSILNATEWRT